jgi:hypothetical protein
MGQKHADPQERAIRAEVLPAGDGSITKNLAWSE